MFRMDQKKKGVCMGGIHPFVTFSTQVEIPTTKGKGKESLEGTWRRALIGCRMMDGQYNQLYSPGLSL